MCLTYREDAARIKNGEGPENWAYFRTIGMTVVWADRESEDSMDSIKSHVKQMAWSDDKLKWLLFHSSFISKAPLEAPGA
jgi:uncharacterized protein YecE (DUF72 family)